MVLPISVAKRAAKPEAKRTARVKLTAAVQETNADPAQVHSHQRWKVSWERRRTRWAAARRRPPDPAEAEAAINAEADKAGAAGNSDLMAKLKAAATNKKIQGAFMDVKNNGVSAAMKYKDDGRALRRNQLQRATRHRRELAP